MKQKGGFQMKSSTLVYFNVLPGGVSILRDGLKEMFK